MHTYYFEKLEVWQNSKELALKIYEITKMFPLEEKYGITNQIRRASLSISSNIAEGFSRNSDKEKIHFLNISYGSTIEVLNFLIFCKELNYLSSENYIELRKKAEYITNQIQALSKSIQQKIKNINQQKY